MNIPLGFEIPSGDPVEIPVSHMVVAGVTQQSGKTTTMEALISRANGLRAVAFVTKRGEGAFSEGRRISPYFSQRADWAFVASILEATMRERMKFERSWIMRAAKGARTLSEVQANVRSLMLKAKGLSADVYMTLDEYLSIVVPQIDRLPYTDSLNLHEGLNVMDLGAYTPELQALVIRSVLEWIYRHEKNTVTIIPESWEFLPQARSSPVLLEAEILIRKGAALHNYLWIDSQDLAAVSKNILRSVSVWLLGVQREMNEVKRTLAYLPSTVRKPKASDITGLKRGQFFVCDGHRGVKVYVQPAWLDECEAAAVAQGREPVPRKAEVNGESENTHFDGINQDISHLPFFSTLSTFVPANATVPPFDRRGEAIEEKDSEMSTEQRLGELVELLRHQSIGETQVRVPQPHFSSATGVIGTDEESMYQRFKARLIKESPSLVRLLASQPELEVRVESKIVEVDGKSLRGRVGRLIAGGFFKSPMRHSDVIKELQRTGPSVNSGNLATTLKDYVKLGFLTIEDDGYMVVAGVKSRIVETK